ncbi:hypothetical protein Tco_0629814 [Tanacetum coccineum]|uniref:Tf2-1-like SH3-like domain-containing protein n=1 Tax=Tanacetum coccineum TaxID=301880 RepID=A0ABQ4WUC1_9ASTR
MIDSEGIHVDPAKIESIKDWTSPKSPIWRSFKILGSKLIQRPTEKIIPEQTKIQAARDRSESYADLKETNGIPIEDKVILKRLRLWKGVVRFGKRGKLNPRYVRPFKVIERVGEVAYKLNFLEAVPLDGLHLDDKLHFVEEPVEIVGREVKRLKRSRISSSQSLKELQESDGTLTRVMDKLDHMVKDFHLFEYNLGMETRKWSEDDKRRSKDFIIAIEKRLQIKRIFRSLESFVGGRIRDIDYRLINRTT